MDARKRRLLYGLYLLATVQLTWCYLWLTRPYVSTRLYEQGLERMPFQGRLLMMLPMRLADGNAALRAVDRLIALSPFWFPRTGRPEVLVQAAIDVACVDGYRRIDDTAVPGKFTTAPADVLHLPAGAGGVGDDICSAHGTELPVSL